MCSLMQHIATLKKVKISLKEILHKENLFLENKFLKFLFFNRYSGAIFQGGRFFFGKNLRRKDSFPSGANLYTFQSQK